MAASDNLNPAQLQVGAIITRPGTGRNFKVVKVKPQTVHIQSVDGGDTASMPRKSILTRWQVADG